MSEKAPRRERQSEPLALIETNQREVKELETPYGALAYLCHQGPEGGREQQQDALVIVADKQTPKVSLAGVDGVKGSLQGKEASLLVAAELEKGFVENDLNDIAKRAQKTMIDQGLKTGAAAFGAVQLPEGLVTWAGDVRVVVIYPDKTPPFTTRDHVNPDERHQLTRYIGANRTHEPEITIIDPPLVPGCIVVIMSDGAYKNLDPGVELIDEDVHDPITDDATMLEETEERRGAKILAVLLRPHATPAEAVRALNKKISDKPAYIDNVTLAVLYIDKKIPLGHDAQEDQELTRK